MRSFDVVVVGGGHAGSEAARAAALRGHRTALFCLSLKGIGNLPCNPSIGGSAKGIVVREIDALGGMMGFLADRHALQFKMLNLSKGPGVHALRAQVDKLTYPAAVRAELERTPHLQVEEAEVVGLWVEERQVQGVVLSGGEKVKAAAVILTTGTYLDADILRGDSRIPAGPDGEPRSSGLAQSLKEQGLRLFRLKTGTPQRLARGSIDFKRLEPQPGSAEPLAFSFDTAAGFDPAYQELCYLTYTTPKTHQIIRDNLAKSAVYGGYVHGVGPRYCPSIEDKIVRFADKERHQLFLEPESRLNDSIYLQGFSTSMPVEIQDLMVRSLPGLEQAQILKYAYAIEYEAIEPLQFDHSLALRGLRGLFAAGQIVGTSGYEEAAALGLIAGLNAANFLEGRPPLILGRAEAYIGVMIDDLVTKGTREPYRLLSSRSEYRLLTRSDNALERLFERGVEQGLNPPERQARYRARCARLAAARSALSQCRVGRSESLAQLLREKGAVLNDPASRSAADLIRSRFASYREIAACCPEIPPLSSDEALSVEIDLRYAGYIELEKKEAERLRAAEDCLLPADLDYQSIFGLSLEAREKLAEIRPRSIGEASRITNVHPADIKILLLYVKSAARGA